MTSIVSKTSDGKRYINNTSALDELEQNNCTMPNITNVVYNVGEKAYEKRDPETGKAMRDADGIPVFGPEVPVLATTVFFCDGTKVTTVNSEHDKIELIDKKLPDGTVVTTASDASKEIGLVYALIKRMVSVPKADGTMGARNFSKILHDVVVAATDQRVNAAKKAAVKNAKNEAPKAASKPKTSKRKCLADVITDFSKIAADFSKIAATFVENTKQV